VITDDMGMAGALSQADLPLACIEAFAAGCDLLLVCEHHDRHEEVIAALGAAIARSPALARRADESARRIANLSAGG
jgi:beta-glucosidase-like glycosyl hydrolase